MDLGSPVILRQGSCRLIFWTRTCALQSPDCTMNTGGLTWFAEASVMISISHNWLFIHIQRTAGNSLQSVLAPYSEDELVGGGFRDGTDRFDVRGPYTATK